MNTRMTTTEPIMTMDPMPEPYGSARRRIAVIALALSIAACTSPPSEAPPAAAESWSVTAWGVDYEIFPEAAPLVAGHSAVAHTHVTRLEDFAPLVSGRVEIVLTGPTGEQVFAADEPARPGIFQIEVTPDTAGEFDLAFRVHAGGGLEQVDAGRVRVGTPENPGRLLVAPAPRGATDGGEPMAFLKEEQWRSDFATGWVRSGSLAGSVTGLARVRPPAGGETSMTAPVAGVLQPSDTWPFVGLEVERGAAVFHLIPHVAADRSLATLEAALTALQSDFDAARTRLVRLEELLELEATSRREVEEARTRAASLEARRAAAERDLEAARSSREGGTEGGLTLRAPFTGEIARVVTSPGATVAAGEPLARLVRTGLLWLEIALPPAGARRLAAEGVQAVVPERSRAGPDPHRGGTEAGLRGTRGVGSLRHRDRSR